MPAVSVGGVAIPIATAGHHRARNDGVDRARMFDNSYMATQIGGAARDFFFATPPLLRSDADAYEVTLKSVAAQQCSGDIIAIPTSCCSEITNWTPIPVAGGAHRVVIEFTLHEVSAANILLKYAPGDTIAGESFTRASSATYVAVNGQLQTVANNVKRDAHYTSINGVRRLLLEGPGTNGWSKSQQFDDAAWSKTGLTVTADAHSAPDGTVTADALIENNLNVARALFRTFAGASDNTPQTASFFLRGGLGRNWVRIATANKAGAVAQSWVNISTGAPGTVSGFHTIRITPLVDSWYRIKITFDSASGATTPELDVSPATADTVIAYLGDGVSGLYGWGAQVETDRPFASSYIATTTAAATRAADSYSLPFVAPPQEISLYAKFVELGTLLANGAVANFSALVNANPQFLVWAQLGFYQVLHCNGLSGSVVSTLSAAPAIGDLVELAAHLFGDGSDEIDQSLNGGAVSASLQSAVDPLAAAWSGQLLILNAAGSGANGYAAFESLKIVAGARSLAELRAA